MRETVKDNSTDIVRTRSKHIIIIIIMVLYITHPHCCSYLFVNDIKKNKSFAAVVLPVYAHK